jgi:hypothetical protein
MSGRRIRVRIDEMVLHGVAPRDHVALVAAFRAELTRVIAAGAPTAARATPSVTLLAPASPTSSALAAGRAAGAAVGRAIGGGNR